MSKHLLVGFLFFIGLVIIGFSTFIVGNFKILSPSHRYEISFDAIEGLKKGDDVRVDGVVIGKIAGFRLAESGVKVFIDVDEPLVLYADHTIFIEAASVLGGSFIAINRGKNIRVKADLTLGLRGKSRKSGLDEIGAMVAENRANVLDVLESLKAVLTDIKNGKGTMGKFLEDDRLYKDLVAIVEDAGKVVKKINAGEGTLAKLVNDPDLYNEAAATIKDLKEMTEKVKKGEGMLGKLMNDETLFNNIKEITEKIKSGTGTIARLLNDDAMANDLKATIADLKETSAALKNILKKIESGEGSVGKLIQDDKLYKKAEETITDVNKIFGKASQVKFYLGGDYKKYVSSETDVARIYAKVWPSEDKYFLIGGSIFSLDPDGDVDYEDKAKGDDETIVRGDIQLAYRVPWILEKRLMARAGLLEGKPGGALDLEWSEFGLFNHPVLFTLEGRDAYNDVDDEDMDENIDGPMIRASASTALAREGFFKNFRLYAGASRLGDDPEFFAGAGFEYEDEDLKTFISLMGLSR